MASLAAALLLLLAAAARAYIPALPSNSSNSTSHDRIELSWISAGFFQADVSRQLVSDAGSTGVSRGAFIHFSETNATLNAPTDAPWVAFINCDSNESDASTIDDIFTLSRDHGAQSVVLYSLTSQACIVNQEYLDNFQKPLDVYSTVMLQTARLLDNQFTNVKGQAFWYDSALLNSSATNIWKFLNDTPVPSVAESSDVSSTVLGDTTSPDEQFTPSSSNLFADPSDSSLEDGATSSSSTDSDDTNSDDLQDPANISQDFRVETAPGLQARAASSVTSNASSMVSTSAAAASTSTSAIYLVAQLAPANATTGTSNNTNTNNANNNNSGSSGSSNTGLAMIILYTITGCVTFLFLVVILSGAARAIRHPERYGPRAPNPNAPNGGGGRTRSQGLARAILDTFPVVKFAASTNNNQQNNRSSADIESGKNYEDSHMEMSPVEHRDGDGQSSSIDQNEADRNHMDDEDAASNNSNHDNSNNSQDPPTTQVMQDGANDMVSAVAAGRHLSKKEGKRRSTESDLSISTSGKRASSIINTTAAAVTTPNKSGVSKGQESSIPSFDDSESCPICVEEWKDGDDVRILPCDRRHRFHRECIDPWLLQQSSLCPLCRWDLRKPKRRNSNGETVIQEEDDDDDDDDESSIDEHEHDIDHQDATSSNTHNNTNDNHHNNDNHDHTRNDQSHNNNTNGLSSSSGSGGGGLFTSSTIRAVVRRAQQQPSNENPATHEQGERRAFARYLRFIQSKRHRQNAGRSSPQSS